MTFTTSFPLRFGHCDPAGIAYYPRYFELCDAAVEDWTAAVLGVDRRTLHLDQGLGLPTVRLDADFQEPSRLGDVLDFALHITGIGRSSLDLDLHVTCGNEKRFGVRYTIVLTDLAAGRSVPWTPEMLDRLSKEVE